MPSLLIFEKEEGPVNYTWGLFPPQLPSRRLLPKAIISPGVITNIHSWTLGPQEKKNSALAFVMKLDQGISMMQRSKFFKRPIRTKDIASNWPCHQPSQHANCTVQKFLWNEWFLFENKGKKGPSPRIRRQFGEKQCEEPSRESIWTVVWTS